MKNNLQAADSLKTSFAEAVVDQVLLVPRRQSPVWTWRRRFKDENAET
ncbi:hypothetical protein COLO4_03693 [Corchorus olitorius]|uniref:Uncharacterized protein n=1 Tax=Corchorus olitorius TaxID=93759 RepID=A0A1R3KXL4_9ROSI|nr:hypothetical protein COLO4_03693 [Corchorus olitorius]